MYDKKVEIQIATNPIFGGRTKHICINCHFVRGRISQKMIETNHEPTEVQLADILPKVLGKI